LGKKAMLMLMLMYMQLLDWDLHPIPKRIKSFVQKRSTTLYLGNHDCTSILEFGYTNDST